MRISNPSETHGQFKFSPKWISMEKHFEMFSNLKFQNCCFLYIMSQTLSFIGTLEMKKKTRSMRERQSCCYLLLKESVVDFWTTSLNVRYCLIRLFVDCTVTNCNFFFVRSFFSFLLDFHFDFGVYSSLHLGTHCLSSSSMLLLFERVDLSFLLWARSILLLLIICSFAIAMTIRSLFLVTFF